MAKQKAKTEVYNPKMDDDTFLPQENEGFFFISPEFSIVGTTYKKEIHAKIVIAGNSFQLYNHADAAMSAMMDALGAVNKTKDFFKRSKTDMELEMLVSSELEKEKSEAKVTHSKGITKKTVKKNKK